MDRVTRNTVIIIILIFATIIGAGLYFGSRPDTHHDPAPAPVRTPQKTNAEISLETCQELVSSRLKAPATAQFHSQVTPNDNKGPWTTTGTVDSENSFGALLRSRFTCTGLIDENGKINTTLNGVL